MNLVLSSDSYKYTHAAQYPPGTNLVYSYLESRGGAFPETVFFGLQAILAKFEGEFSVKATDVLEAEELISQHLGPGLFNKAGWQHIVHDHYGRLPLRIKAVPEGTVVPVHNVLMTIENTCRRCFWLTNFMETLLMQVWYPITVATQSREIKRVILNFLNKTGDPNLIDFKLHDFGFRGVSSVESAGIGGGAHLTQFRGTDTVAALVWLKKHYAAGCAGFSIPASEHSTMTSWGKDNEVAANRNMLQQFPTGLVAIVSDSYDINRACTEILGKELKADILNRDGVVIVRPDSGEPVSEMVLNVVNRLGAAFGFIWNDKGFKVLHPRVRVIQGDGVNKDSIYDVLQTLQGQGWSADNIAFGMGGALLQKLDRDTQRMAIKCSYVEGVNYTESGPDIGTEHPWSRDVFKQPASDKGKASKPGRLALVRKGGILHTQAESLTKPEDNLLQTVFDGGRVLIRSTLGQIRERSAL